MSGDHRKWNVSFMKQPPAIERQALSSRLYRLDRTLRVGGLRLEREEEEKEEEEKEA
jgi:hypothetical protein